MVAKLVTLLGIFMVLAVACGGAPAAPEPTAASPTEPTAAPTGSETSQPTPVPQMEDPPPPAQVEVNTGNLTIMVGDLGTERFDFSFATGPEPRNYGRIIGGFLISTNEKTEMVPGIAREWDLSDDGLTWSFTIREGVKFHDGSEVTPEDVLWTLRHTWGPQATEYTNVSTVMTVSRIMDKIELTEPAKVSLTTTQPVTTFAVGISEAGSGWYHVMPKRSTVGNTEEALVYDQNPIGAGIMKLVDHVPASAMKFERFDDYYYQPDNGFPEDKRVSFQLLDMLVVPEEATRVAALRAGEVDIAPASLTTKEQVEAGGGRLIFGQEGALLQGKFFGCYDPQYPCHDKRVRQALDYAIDKELIRDRLFGGAEVFQIKGWGEISPSTIGYTPEIDPWPFDPEKARQLLAEAGYPNGEGFGKLILNTYPSASLPFLVESAQLVADFWRRELALDVEVSVLDSVGMDKKEKAGELNGQIQWRDNNTQKDATNVLANAYGDPNRPDRMHGDPELFPLVQKTVQIVDAEERERATAQLFLRLRDETYEFGIGYANIPWAVGSRVQIWKPYPLATYPSALHTITLK